MPTNRDDLETELRTALATMSLAELSRVQVTVGSIERARARADFSASATYTREVVHPSNCGDSFCARCYGAPIELDVDQDEHGGEA